ncbi:unnamed protein product [Sphenostylis stenocarpa]|uniref:Dirigent protein n=1 Tax=Sphenostylis stenocarpa TaxID=92480 RepID=A0AA86SPM2_9FABA|nr:unnamed protein product [Sphenostylis stenocarpa]
MSALFGLILLVVCSDMNTIEGEFIEESHIVLPTDRVERFTHLHFYFHDILDGEHPTAVRIIDPPRHSPGGFGVTFMVDNPLTEGPELSSKEVGRAQGSYALASQHDLGFKMSQHMLGRNAVLDEIREMPIVGGSGAFRFARGYALAKTVWSNSTSGSAIVEYNGKNKIVGIPKHPKLPPSGKKQFPTEPGSEEGIQSTVAYTPFMPLGSVVHQYHTLQMFIGFESLRFDLLKRILRYLVDGLPDDIGVAQ